MGEGVRAEGLHELYLRSESRLGTLRRTQVLGADPQDDLLPGEPREAAARHRQAYPARERSGGAVRSEERRVGKVCVRTCRSRGTPDSSKKTKPKNVNII